MASPTLRSVLAELERCAPLQLAESWDNVGLLIEPHAEDVVCERLLLTIDFTWDVLDEARRLRAPLVVAYHPVLFGGLTRLRASQPLEGLVMATLQSGVTIYSPHTALDAVAGGMTDWLAGALGSGSTRALVPARADLAHSARATPLRGAPKGVGQAIGQGRLVTLDEPLELGQAVEAIKAHLGLEHLRLAAAPRHQQGSRLSTFAVCPGAGGKVFEQAGDVDLLLTGEMRHHDVLARNARGTSVILCDHTNSERGFLPVFAEALAERLPDVAIHVAAADRDPLAVV